MVIISLQEFWFQGFCVYQNSMTIHLRILHLIVSSFYIRRKNILNIEFQVMIMNAEVFRGRCIVVCNSLGNLSPQNQLCRQMDRCDEISVVKTLMGKLSGRYMDFIVKILKILYLKIFIKTFWGDKSPRSFQKKTSPFLPL